MFHITSDREFLLTASNQRTLLVDSRMISPKTTKNTAGVNTLTLKSKNYLLDVKEYHEGDLVRPDHYRTKNIPAAGSFLKDEDSPQLRIE